VIVSEFLSSGRGVVSGDAEKKVYGQCPSDVKVLHLGV
jgi:hypothetical protein